MAGLNEPDERLTSRILQYSHHSIQVEVVMRRAGLVFLLSLLLAAAAGAQDSLNVTRVGQLAFSPGGSALGVAVNGSYAYVADSESGLRIVNIADPASPVLVGTCDTPALASGVALSGNYAYIADNDLYGVYPLSGLLAIDVTNPAAPQQVGYYDTQGIALGIAVSGSHAYMADGDCGLRVINVSNPAAPYEVGFYNTPQYATGVTVSGTYAYIADGLSGLRVISIANPASPQEVGFYNTPGYARSVALSGDYACVADDDCGLRVINIANPANPQEVGFCDTPDWAQCVAVSGDLAFVADYFGGLRVINIANPAAPVQVGYYLTPGQAYGVAVSGEYIYVADDYYLGVYQYQPEIHEVQVTLAPVNPPIQIPASGGSFAFDGTLANLETSPQIFDLWIMVQLPNQSWYGPVLGPLNLTLPASGSLTRQRTQVIPGSAPVGDYWYESRVGDYPGTVWDTSGFAFSKLGTGDWGLGAGEVWACTGEPFPSERSQGSQTLFLPSGLTLNASPNPFNPTTAMSYELQAASRVTLRVYDTAGREVWTLVDGWREAGSHAVTFDATGLPSGIYFARLTAGGFAAVEKLVLLK